MFLKDGMSVRKKKVMFRRGASILPSVFTLLNMFFGYLAILYAIKGNIEHSVNLVLLAGIIDLLDGRIARMTGTSSEFGKELDSLSDFLSFGIAPALILYFWGFSGIGRFGSFLVFLLPLAGGIRLARFNILTSVVDKRYFVGLPIPSAAAAALLPLYFLDKTFLENIKAYSHSTLVTIKFVCLFYVVLIAFLMVSTIKYRSFKDFDIKQRKPAPFFFFLMFFFILILLWPFTMLLIMAEIYLFSGPMSYLYERLKAKFRLRQVKIKDEK